MKESSPLHLAARADARIVRVVAQLQQEPGRTYKWDALAREVNLSLGHLERLFKHATGQTPQQYLRDLRLRRACELLATIFLSAKQIAIELGFEHETSFYRAFKQAMGMPPLAYRKRCEMEKKEPMLE